ncbi:hypothetical protein D3C87_1152710 [compost metagenome]
MGIENFESIDALIEMLKKEGASDIAQQIQDAIDRASTGTELYAGVGFVMGKVAKSQVSEVTKARAAKIRNEISELIDMTFNEPED